MHLHFHLHVLHLPHITPCRISRSMAVSLLNKAVSGGDFGMVQCFVDAGAVVTGEELFTAVSMDDSEMARFLVGAGADVNTVRYDEDYGQVTPLHLAVINENFEMVRLLLGAGADVSDSGGRSPISFAVERGNVEIVRFLVGAGAGVALG